MKNLSKIVDQIIKIEPELKPQLLTIKTKWENSNKIIYWKQLLKILNTEITMEHPKRSVIENLLNPKKKTIPKKINTFEPPSPSETVVGVLPENMECKIRRQDRLQVEYSKSAVEARMTHNTALMVDINKKCELLEIEQKKLWVDIKNHFNLWEVSTPSSFFVRSQGPLLVLTVLTLSSTGFLPGNNDGESPVKIDPEMMWKLIRFLKQQPPNKDDE